RKSTKTLFLTAEADRRNIFKLSVEIGIWRGALVRGWIDALPPALVRVALHAVNQNFNNCRGQSYLD
ncbi:MAG: hypothetical protein SPG79_06230, partial [Candidatus Faecousia sp.]|nr:hypothetical protein [Candidatus Faecousia sp.]